MKLRILVILASLLVLLTTSCEVDPVAKENTIVNLTRNYDNAVILEWSDLYLNIEKDLAGFRPASTARALAYINMASYEAALPGMPEFVSNELRQKGLNIPDLPTEDIAAYHWNLAINAAMSRCLDHFLINKTAEQGGLIKDLEANVNKRLASEVSQEVFNNSQTWGRLVAEAIIAYAKTDVEAEAQILDPSPDAYAPVEGEGKWAPAPGGKALYPYWGKVRTFANTGNALNVLPPPVYSISPASHYFRDFKEVNTIISDNKESGRWMAEFWSDDIVGLTFSPPARIFAIANQIIKLEQTDLETTLHLYCKLGIAENDGAVAAWKAKYEYNVERPVQFIRAHINPDFTTLLGGAIGSPGLTPSFPGYPSGHSTFGGLGAEILSFFFGNDYYFTDRCHEGRTEFFGLPRSYATIRELGEENAYSRIFLGVHPRFDCVEGIRLGRQIAKNTLNYKLRKS
ncbi:MAG: vanadium-dependent haloperoxidase [Saprospiraceae bacterium]|nr:vanadium-dependent haloperoxidase [Saprospiraceae bacterium]